MGHLWQIYLTVEGGMYGFHLQWFVMWNIPIRLVTPNHPSVINVSHQEAMCNDCNSKWMASRWNGHYSLCSFSQNWWGQKTNFKWKSKVEELIMKNYRNPNNARLNALELSVQQETMTTIMTEDQCALEGLLNLDIQKVENQQYVQHQTLEYPEMGNVTQPQF